ncbi:hypothetical protein MMC13_000787 [Lambiella insularis]|nr:hypothetical protein [Lambiella insularis]
MYFNLGMPAVAAATHKHEFNSAENQPNMDPEHGFLHPLTYLHNRLSALTTFSSATTTQALSAVQTKPPIFHDNASETPPDSYDDIPDHESVQNLASVSGSKRKGDRSRTTTSFQLAHPPPATKHKQRRNARVLLQLRQISDSRNPVPALEVFPATVFASRLLRRFPRLLNNRRSLGANDLIVVNSQEYGAKGKDSVLDDDSDSEDWENREVVGIICPSTRGDLESKDDPIIYLDQDSGWTASSMAHGGYEFTKMTPLGFKVTARWISRTSKHKRRVSDTRPKPSLEDERDKKFKFSVLNPQSRRHPVIASMDRQTINISDQWAFPSTPSATPTTSSPTVLPTQSLQQCYFDEEHLKPDSINVTDDHLKTLVLITGIWVALREGWSESCKLHIDSYNSMSSNTSSPLKDRTASGRHENGSDMRTHTPQSFGSARSRQASFKILHLPHTSSISAPSSPANLGPQRARSLGANSTDHNTKIRNISFAKPRIQATLKETSEVGREVVSSGAVSAVPSPVSKSHSTLVEQSIAPPKSAGMTDKGTFAAIELNGAPKVSMDSHLDGTTTPQSALFSHTSSISGKKKKGKVGRLLSYMNRKSKKSR